MSKDDAREQMPLSEKLEKLSLAALDIAKKAKRNHKSLNGDNFYSNKLATLRADATNVFRGLTAHNTEDCKTITVLIEKVFSAATALKERVAASKDLHFELRTKWVSVSTPQVEDGLFPLSLLSTAKRAYLVTIGRQMNGAYTSGWFDAAAVMMRRLVEVSIIEAFEGVGTSANIKGKDGNYLQLSDLVSATLAERSWQLSRNAKTAFPKLRDIGHMSAHGRYFTAQKSDLDSLKDGCRVVVEEMLRHAKLL